jgi:hypothetical protein
MDHIFLNHEELKSVGKYARRRSHSGVERMEKAAME